MAEENIEDFSNRILESLRPHLDRIEQNNVSFREAAKQNNDNLNSIIKTIYNILSNRTQEIDNLSTTIETNSSQVDQITRDIKLVNSSIIFNNQLLFRIDNRLSKLERSVIAIRSEQNTVVTNFSKFRKMLDYNATVLGRTLSTGGGLFQKTVSNQAARSLGGGVLKTLAGLGVAGAAGLGLYNATQDESIKGAAEPSTKKRSESGQEYYGKPSADDDFTSLSAKYESGGRGVGFVSSGAGDPGGPSYGVHQLSSKDSMPAFLRSEEGKPYADQFRGLTPGSAEFNKVYKSVAEQHGKNFEKAQKDYYIRTHFNPLYEHAKKLGFDVENPGVKSALFSMSVQHGRASQIVSNAASSGIGSSPEEQIKSLYNSRRTYVAGLNSLPERTKQSVLNRYRNEESDALGRTKPKPEQQQQPNVQTPYPREDRSKPTSLDVPLEGGASERGFEESIGKMNPELRARLSAVYNDPELPEYIKKSMKIGSGFRDPNDPRIQELYRRHIASGSTRPMADPRRSMHGKKEGYGGAADIAGLPKDPESVKIIERIFRKHGLHAPVRREGFSDSGYPHIQIMPDALKTPYAPEFLKKLEELSKQKQQNISSEAQQTQQGATTVSPVPGVVIKPEVQPTTTPPPPPPPETQTEQPKPEKQSELQPQQQPQQPQQQHANLPQPYMPQVSPSVGSNLNNTLSTVQSISTSNIPSMTA